MVPRMIWFKLWSCSNFLNSLFLVAMRLFVAAAAVAQLAAAAVDIGTVKRESSANIVPGVRK
jgi:hypothetical protein